MADEAAEYREKLIESAVEMNDEIMERYLNGDEIKDEEIEACLKDGHLGPKDRAGHGRLRRKDYRHSAALRQPGQVFPRSPLYRERPKALDPKTGKAVDRQMTSGEPFSAFVFKTITDPFAGKLTLFKVYSGELHPDSVVLERQEG